MEITTMDCVIIRRQIEELSYKLVEADNLLWLHVEKDNIEVRKKLESDVGCIEGELDRKYLELEKLLKQLQKRSIKLN